MIAHKINKLENFISGWYLDDTKICDKLINFHQNSNQKNPGVIGATDNVYGAEIVIDKQSKDSVDVVLDNENLFFYIHGYIATSSRSLCKTISLVCKIFILGDY